MTDHAACPSELRTIAKLQGLDVHVSTEPPLVKGPYFTEEFVCPHGTTYWIEPTGEQITKWVKDGVA